MLRHIGHNTYIIVACIVPMLFQSKHRLRQVDMITVRVTCSPRARGGLFVLKGSYDLRVTHIVKFSQESESARLTKIILSKKTVKTL